MNPPLVFNQNQNFSNCTVSRIASFIENKERNPLINYDHVRIIYNIFIYKKKGFSSKLKSMNSVSVNINKGHIFQTQLKQRENEDIHNLA